MAEKLITALLLHRDRAAWTSLRDRKGGTEIVQQVDAPLDVPAEADAYGPEMAAQVKARCSGIRGDVTLVIPTSKTLMRVVNLPSTDPAELRDMAELQVDKFSPYPVDQMCIGHEVLAQNGEQSRVLVAAVPRETIDGAGSICAAAGILPTSVDVGVMGWWWLLQSKGHIADAGRQVLLVFDKAGWDLVVAQDGTPVLIRALGTSITDATGAAQEIAEEINYTLATLETEWGGAPVDALNVWHGEGVDAAFIEALTTTCAEQGLLVRSSPLATLASLSEGIARRVHQAHGASMDLSPAEWKSSIINRAERRRMIFIAVSVMVLWGLALAGVMFLQSVEQKKQFVLRNEVKRLDTKAAEVRNLQKQVQSLQKYADRKYSALECLRELCTLMPPGPELDSYNYEKFQQISLRGNAESDAPIYEFVKQLQASPFYPKVEPGQITTVRRNDRTRYEFKATITLPAEENKEAKKK